jgi:hypothetical protein
MRIEPVHRRQERVILRQRNVDWGRDVRVLSLSRLYIDDFHISRARPVIYLPEHKFFGARHVQQRQVFRGRSDEDQVIVFRVVQRKQTPAFHAKRLVKCREHPAPGCAPQELLALRCSDPESALSRPWSHRSIASPDDVVEAVVYEQEQTGKQFATAKTAAN